MGSIQSSATLLAPNNPLSAIPTVDALESKIAAAAAELDFYHKLLSWLLLSCHEDKRFTIERFRKELAELRNGDFSVLLAGVRRLKNAAREEMGHPDLYSDVVSLHMYFNHMDETFHLFKSRIYRQFSNFTHVCIW